MTENTVSIIDIEGESYLFTNKTFVTSTLKGSNTDITVPYREIHDRAVIDAEKHNTEVTYYTLDTHLPDDWDIVRLSYLLEGCLMIGNGQRSIIEDMAHCKYVVVNNLYCRITGGGDWEPKYITSGFDPSVQMLKLQGAMAREKEFSFSVSEILNSSQNDAGTWEITTSSGLTHILKFVDPN